MEWIYLLHNPAFPMWYKIGRTSSADPYDRLEKYNEHTPFSESRFEFLGMVENSKEVERRLIEYCEDKGFVRAKMEWLRFKDSEGNNKTHFIDGVLTNSVKRRII